MSAAAETNALDVVRQSPSERRQGSRSSSSASSSSVASKAHHPAHGVGCDKAPPPPSPSSAAQFLMETNAHVTRNAQQQHASDDDDDDQVNAYWAWLATTCEPPIQSTGTAGPSSSLPSPPVQRASQQQQQQPRRISYYAGFLPGTLDREELSNAVRVTQMASIDAGADGVSSAVPLNEREAETVGWGGGTSSSATGGAAKENSLHSRRRRSTLSGNSGGGVSRASMARAQDVTFDVTLAEAMVATSRRIQAHEAHQQEQQQQRRRSSVTGGGVDRRASWSCEEPISPGQDAAAVVATGALNSPRCRRGSDNRHQNSYNNNSNSNVRGGGDVEGAAAWRVSPLSSALFPTEMSMRTEGGTTTTTAAEPLTSPRQQGRKQRVKDRMTAAATMRLSGDAAPSTTSDYSPWKRQNAPIFSGNGAVDGEHDRALTWANGALPPLSEPKCAPVRHGHVSQHQQQRLSQRKSSSSVAAASAPTAYSPPRRSLTERSSRQSTTGSTPMNTALTDSGRDLNGARSGNRPYNNGNSSSSSGSTDPQLSHHQLTEAFYGSYKGGKMARDAYLYFIAQQQQQRGSQSAACGTTPSQRSARRSKSGKSSSSSQEARRRSPPPSADSPGKPRCSGGRGATDGKSPVIVTASSPAAAERQWSAPWTPSPSRVAPQARRNSSLPSPKDATAVKGRRSSSFTSSVAAVARAVSTGSMRSSVCSADTDEDAERLADTAVGNTEQAPGHEGHRGRKAAAKMANAVGAQDKTGDAAHADADGASALRHHSHTEKQLQQPHPSLQSLLHARSPLPVHRRASDDTAPAPSPPPQEASSTPPVSFSHGNPYGLKCRPPPVRGGEKRVAAATAATNSAAAADNSRSRLEALWQRSKQVYAQSHHHEQGHPQPPRQEEEELSKHA
ncbi:hypothetical protein ABB37_09659 [Leptomonas pyrrhocoris]|uniref:Uncharacterized protein n=1 Tax=Leptomonas pyrrhocoris TaxID=157538 RepID=A0A0M9FQ29_LEPPY|nr:hypothetical protein ABB37_09659 [Leptomonas pyrrhocoris]KPA73765.1 hypothetical protein ABB37_09659 [Leptomonas pyrrhocoris]|eukprot:XP_015652204.1 hypothetical protein ABB37_09659 [Leptomonas pyrrhocoris]